VGAKVPHASGEVGQAQLALTVHASAFGSTVPRSAEAGSVRNDCTASSSTRSFSFFIAHPEFSALRRRIPRVVHPSRGGFAGSVPGRATPPERRFPG